MEGLAFTKMHGLGNDFVVVDGRARAVAFTAAQARAIADRRTGVGFDQLIVLEPPTNGAADVFMRILNADGSESGACGNATRCVAAQVMAEKGAATAVVETISGLLETSDAGAGLVTVDMGPARTDWRDIPLAEQTDTLHVGIGAGVLRDPVAVNVGNPHAVFFVDDAEAVPLAELGPEIENHPLYPQRTNVEAAQVLSPDRIRLRVWERGVGITLASGSCASATLVAAHRRGLAERKAEVVLDGGTLVVEWRDDGHVTQTGPHAVAFSGRLDPALLEAGQ